MLSFAVNHYLTGLDPAPMKATNLAIHLFNVLLVFGLARCLLRFRLQERAQQGQLADWLALAVAALWALHPINLMAVLLIVQRMESLGHLFVFAGLWLYAATRMRQLAGKPGGWPALLTALLASPQSEYSPRSRQHCCRCTHSCLRPVCFISKVPGREPESVYIWPTCLHCGCRPSSAAACSCSRPLPRGLPGARILAGGAPADRTARRLDLPSLDRVAGYRAIEPVPRQFPHIEVAFLPPPPLLRCLQFRPWQRSRGERESACRSPRSG